MYKNCLLVIFFLVLAVTQTEAKKLKGYVIYNNQEKVEVLISVPFVRFSSKPDYLKMQTKVTCLQNNINIVVYPENALEISFMLDDEPVRMLSVDNDLQLGPGVKRTKKVFVKLEVDGVIKLFRSYEVSTSPGMYNSPVGLTTDKNSRIYDRFVLQRDHGPLTRLDGTSFKKDVAEFFFDCPDLIQKTEAKEFKKEDLKRMVQIFNSTCATEVESQ